MSTAAAPTTAAALRFLTAGSVDDGKSTLIGRLLYDSRAILADQLDSLQRRAGAAAAAAGAPAFDLSLLTDGLEAEREQGITIDVAYRYFATPSRKFIIADAPGHEQYTRNMVTAAAGSDAAVVLVDITKLDLGARPVRLLTQTRRHALLARLLRVPSIVFAVNKLDAVADPGAAYRDVRAALLSFCAAAGIEAAGIVPVSALLGSNVTQPLAAPWYGGPSLLQLLEGLPAGSDPTGGPLRLPVQYVARDHHATGDRPRVLWGRIAQGQLQVGDEVEVFPSGERSRVKALYVAAEAVTVAHAEASAGVALERQLDVSRGDWLGAPGTVRGTRRFGATVAWLDPEPAVVGRRYRLRHGHRWVPARLTSITHRLDIGSLERSPSDTLAVNDIGEAHFELQHALPLAPYAQDRVGGALIAVDPATHRTSAALLVQQAAA
jgi:sulfate adenylyltransferase subunit 1